MPPFAAIVLSVPSLYIGLIGMWWGNLPSIPKGWVLCDGTQDTPDLRDKMIIASGPVHPHGDFDGSSDHSHTIYSDTHDHTIVAGSGVSGGYDRNKVTGTQVLVCNTDSENNLPPFYSLAYIMYKG